MWEEGDPGVGVGQKCGRQKGDEVLLELTETEIHHILSVNPKDIAQRLKSTSSQSIP